MANRIASNTQISTVKTVKISAFQKAQAVMTACLFGSKEAARIHGVSPSSVHNWMQKDSMNYHYAQKTKPAKDYKESVGNLEGSFTKDYVSGSLRYTNDFRREVAMYAADYGVSSAVQKFGPTATTIYKWLRSFNLDGYYFANYK